MPGIIILIAAILAVSVFRDGDDLVGKILKIPSQSQLAQVSQQPTPKPKSYTAAKVVKETKEVSPTPGVFVDTYITYGPLENEIIKETTDVVFDFRAVVLPENTQGQISFETKIEGFDQDWQKTYSQERTAKLPAGPKEYSFLVRARINDAIDATPAKRNFKINVSPYFGKAKIGNVTPPTLYTPSLIAISSYFGGEEKIKITGWKIEGKETKRIFIISQGVEKYNSLNPLFKEDIFIKSGDTVYISSTASPLGLPDLNFRPNKCLGYLIGPKNCPGPRSDRLPRYLSTNCQNFINSRPSCESLNYERLKNWDIFNDAQCLSYIEANFTYPGCFLNYSKDSDFLQREWRIYTNTTPDREIMHFKEDTLYLKDQNGLLVDKYSY